MIDKNILDDNSKAMDELSEGIYQLLLEKGYKLEVGSKCNATYGKGSKIGRVLLGAFINAICIFS